MQKLPQISRKLDGHGMDTVFINGKRMAGIGRQRCENCSVTSHGKNKIDIVPKWDVFFWSLEQNVEGVSKVYTRIEPTMYCRRCALTFVRFETGEYATIPLDSLVSLKLEDMLIFEVLVKGEMPTGRDAVSGDFSHIDNVRYMEKRENDNQDR